MGLVDDWMNEKITFTSRSILNSVVPRLWRIESSEREKEKAERAAWRSECPWQLFTEVTDGRMDRADRHLDSYMILTPWAPDEAKNIPVQSIFEICKACFKYSKFLSDRTGSSRLSIVSLMLDWCPQWIIGIGMNKYFKFSISLSL